KRAVLPMLSAEQLSAEERRGVELVPVRSIGEAIDASLTRSGFSHHGLALEVEDHAAGERVEAPARRRAVEELAAIAAGGRREARGERALEGLELVLFFFVFAGDLLPHGLALDGEGDDEVAASDAEDLVGLDHP